MGFCIPMSVRSVTKKKTPLPAVIWRITWRSLKLFALGFFFGNKGSYRVSQIDSYYIYACYMSLLFLGWINLAYVRVPGVLQRFAICYFVVAITGVLAARIHGDEDDSEKVI